MSPTRKSKYEPDDEVTYYYDHPKWRRFKRIVWRCIWIPSLIGFILFTIASTILYVKIKPMWDSTPALSIQKLQPSNPTHTVIKASDGTVLWQNSPIQMQMINDTQLNNATNLKNALLSIEDRRFYQESGVNYTGTLRAVISDVVHHNQGQGGSTLTQQLIKMSYFAKSANIKSVQRKVQEMRLANELNNILSKDQVLMAYMNKVYMGQGIFGMNTAAHYYMNRSIDTVSIPQAALLAGLVQSPSGYDPYVHPLAATARRNTVLKTMLETHKISKQKYQQFIKIPLKKTIVPFSDHVNHSMQIQKRAYIADNYLQSVRQELLKQGFANRQSQIVDTPLNWPLQSWLVDAVKHNRGMALPNKELQVGITVMNNHNGAVIAQLGTRNFHQLDGYNRATQSVRSTGSVIKPIFDYGPVMDQSHWGSNHILDDAKYYYPHTKIQVHDWDNKYMGKMTAKQALILSRNVPAIKAFVHTGTSTVQKYANAIGIKSKLTPSNAIGVSASSQQMASAFSALAQSGRQVDASYINKIQFGNQFFRTQPVYRALFSEQTAYMLTNALKGVPQTGQSGYAAKISGFTQAGKTGTIGYDGAAGMPSNAISDAWYVGYTKDYTIAVWTGYDNPNQKQHYLKNTDNKIAETIYRSIMMQLRHRKLTRNSDWSKPSGLQLMQDGSYEFKGTPHLTFNGTREIPQQ